MVDIGGELSLHHDFTQPITKQKMERLQELLDILTFNLMKRGMYYVDTWIEEGDKRNYRFVEHFGFVDTETLKLVKVGEQDFTFRVFRLFFPTDELMEGIRD